MNTVIAPAGEFSTPSRDVLCGRRSISDQCRIVGVIDTHLALIVAWRDPATRCVIPRWCNSPIIVENRRHPIGCCSGLVRYVFSWFEDMQLPASVGRRAFTSTSYNTCPDRSPFDHLLHESSSNAVIAGSPAYANYCPAVRDSVHIVSLTCTITVVRPPVRRSF